MKTVRLHVDLPEKLWQQLDVLTQCVERDMGEMIWFALLNHAMIASELEELDRIHAHLEDTYGEMHQYLESGGTTGKIAVSFRFID